MASICNLYMTPKKFNRLYLTGLIISTLFMILILVFWIRITSFTFLIFFWVVKFLSGFGLILSITNGFLFLLSRRKDKLSKRGTNLIIIFQIFIPIILILYAIDKLYSGYVGSASTLSMTGIWADIYVWFDNIIYIYGILSLLAQLYLIPIFKHEFDEVINKGRNQKLGRSLKNYGRNVKKQWLKWRAEDAKVKYLDQKSIKELLNNWRNRFAVILLIPLGIGSLLFTPITYILIIMWAKIIIWDRSEIYSFEKIAIFISIILIGLIAVLTPYFEFGIYSQIANSLWTLNIFYLIGILGATLIFIVKLLSLQGVSISSYIKNRRKRKKELMKQEIKSLKKETKTLANKSE